MDGCIGSCGAGTCTLAKAFECDRCHELFRYWPRPWDHFKFDWDMKMVSRHAGHEESELCIGCYIVVLERMLTAMKVLAEIEPGRVTRP